LILKKFIAIKLGFDKKAYKTQKEKHFYFQPIFNVQRYASVVYAVIVFLSICPSQASTVPKQLNVGSPKQCHLIAQGFKFSATKDLAKFEQGHP